MQDMRHLVWIRVVLLLAVLFVVSGGVMTAAQEPVADFSGGRDSDWAQLFGDADELFRPVSVQNDGAVRPADAPASCTRIGFNGSLEGWTVHSGAWYTGTEYIYTYGANPGEVVSISYGLDLTRTDFQARMWRKGSDECLSGIVIRGNPEPLTSVGTWDTGYVLYYQPNGQCAVIKAYYDGGRWVSAPYYWTHCPAVNQGEAWNTLRAVADGNQLSFYINDQLIWSGQDSYNSHGRVGIVMRKSSEPTTEDELRVEWASLCWPYASYLPVVVRR